VQEPRHCRVTANASVETAYIGYISHIVSLSTSLSLVTHDVLARGKWALSLALILSCRKTIEKFSS